MTVDVLSELQAFLRNKKIVPDKQVNHLVSSCQIHSFLKPYPKQKGQPSAPTENWP